MQHWHKILGSSLILMAFWLSQAGVAQAAAVTCSDAESCNAALKQLQAKLAQGQQKIKQGQKAVSSYGAALDELGAEIQATQQKIIEMQGQVTDVNGQIKQLNDQIAAENAQLDDLRAQIRDDFVSMYEASQVSRVTLLFSNLTLSQATADANRLQMIQEDIQEKVALTKSIQADLEQQKAALEQRKDTLTTLQDNLTGQQKDLSYQTRQTNRLLNSTKSQIQTYVADQAVIKQQIAETQRKLASLIQETHWGNGIASAPTAGWTYSQLNYYQTLGDSPYTVHDYGCLITSLAMVASFYGNHVTPAQIANHTSWFDGSGYARTPSIAAGIGLTIKEHSGIDWSVVDEELQAGHPVIVSIYLPQVGAINSDGSSHFIVLQAKSGSTYLMQDPLGPNRSYSLNYVRSMYVVE